MFPGQVERLRIQFAAFCASAAARNMAFVFLGNRERVANVVGVIGDVGRQVKGYADKGQSDFGDHLFECILL